MASDLAPILPVALVAGAGMAALSGGGGERRVWAGLGYLALFLSVWAIGHPSVQGSPQLGAFGVVALLWVLVGVVGRGGDARRLVWIGVALTLSLSVAMASGPEGGPGRLMRFLTETVGLDLATADAVNFAVRKSVHVVFYGLIAWTFARALLAAGPGPTAPALILAALWTLGHAAFDELNQTRIPGRTGLLSDFLLDAAGVTIALGALAWCLRRRPEP